MFITNTSLHSDFVPLAEHLNNLQNKYDSIKDNALLIRMEMIGICEDYKRKHNQRSAEARYIQAGYDANGWSASAVSKSYKAYQLKQSLLDNVNPEFVHVAKLASYRQLYELSGADDTATTYYAAMYLKNNGSLPPVKAIAGHKAGHFTDDFVSKASITAGKRKENDVAPERPQHLPDQPGHERIVTEHEQSQAELIVKGDRQVGHNGVKPPKPSEPKVAPAVEKKNSPHLKPRCNITNQSATEYKLKSCLYEVERFAQPMSDEIRSLIEQLYAHC